MKKLLVTLFLCYSVISFAQEDSLPQDTDKKHEIKFNALSLITSEWLDFSYEYLINEESSFGINLQYDLDGKNDIYDTTRNWSITPYYRRYFSNKYARGFYLEGFTMLHNTRNDFYGFDGSNYVFQSENKTHFALGISFGYKIVSKGGFTLDTYLGVGRNLGNNQNFEQVSPRIGLSLGYRF
jgi:hypothetical protein